MNELVPGRRYSGRLLDIHTTPLALSIAIDGVPGQHAVALADTALRPDVEAGAVRTALGAALGQQVQVEIRSADGLPMAADVWYHEPIIEDDEVEYTAPCHLRTMLVRAGLVQF